MVQGRLGREQAQQHCCRKLLCRRGVNCCVHRDPLHERHQPIAKNTSDAHLEAGVQVRVADALVQQVAHL